MVALKFWSVRTPSRSRGFITTLAETKEEAVALVQDRGHRKHDRAKRSHCNGTKAMLPDGTYLANVTYTVTPDGNDNPGWAILRKAGGRGGYQQEVVRFLNDEEAQEILDALEADHAN